MLNWIVKFLLGKGIGYIEQLAKEKEEVIEKAVKDAIPGEMFDEVAWGVVKSLIPIALSAAKKFLESMSVESLAASDEQVAAVAKEVEAA